MSKPVDGLHTVNQQDVNDTYGRLGEHAENWSEELQSLLTANDRDPWSKGTCICKSVDVSVRQSNPNLQLETAFQGEDIKQKV